MQSKANITQYDEQSDKSTCHFQPLVKMITIEPLIFLDQPPTQNAQVKPPLLAHKMSKPKFFAHLSS